MGCRRYGMSDKRTQKRFKVQSSAPFISCRRSGISEKWDILEEKRNLHEGSLFRIMGSRTGENRGTFKHLEKMVYMEYLRHILKNDNRVRDV